MDLIAALIFMVSLVVAAAIAGHGLAIRSRHSQLFLGISLLVAVVVDRLVIDRLFLAQWLPSSSANVIWTNVTPVLLAAACGLMSAMPDFSTRRLWITVLPLSLLVVATLVQPIVRPLLRPVVHDVKNQWVDGVCLQSSESTCGSAAAATLLRYHKVWATEQSMKPLCLTSSDGSPAFGVYRGVHSAANWLGYEPSVVVGTFDSFMDRQPFPAIVLVRHERNVGDWKSRLADSISRRRGHGHALVVFGADENGNLDIGDPAIGRKSIGADEFRELWAGEAICLKRSSAI